MWLCSAQLVTYTVILYTVLHTQFLEIGSKGGCTFNPAKFQFAQLEVEFLGFKITPNGIKTNDEFLNNILNFPAPQNITDVRAW